MNLMKINDVFRRVGTWQIAKRIPLLIGCIAITAIGISGVPRLTTSSGEEGWFDDSESIKKDTDRFQDIFGNEESIAILVKAKDVFDPEVLRAINDAGTELLEGVPYANRVTSLATAEISVGTEEGIEVITPFEDGIPEDKAEIEKARDLVLSRQSLKNRLVSDDCTETWVHLSLHAYPKEGELGKGEKDPLYVVGEAARKILEDPKWKSDTYTFYPAGTPYTESEELEWFSRETTKRVIMGFIAMIVCLLVFLHSFRGILIPAFTTVAGIAVVFGIMGWTGVKADATLMSLPIILGMALSVGYSIHLFNAIKCNLRKTGRRKEAVIDAVAETGWPILFTALTTIAGLISFLFANIGPLRWLGLACSSVVMTVYLYTFVLVPVLLSFGHDREPIPASEFNGGIAGIGRADHIFGCFGEVVIRRAKPILAISLIAFAAFIPGIGRSGVNMDYFEMMGMKIPYIQRLDRIINSKLGSYLDYNVMIAFPEADTAKAPNVMNRLDRFMTTVGGYKMTKRAGETPKAASVLDIVKEMNRTLNSDDPVFYAVPDDPDMLAQLLFLYEISGGTGLSQWVSDDYSCVRAQFDITGYDANGLVRDIDAIKKLGAELFPEAKISVIGGAANYAAMNRKIVVGQLISFAAAFAIICVLMMITFGSVLTGLIAMIPNVAPVIIVGGLMGYLGWPLDMLTMTVMPMILGIAVDDTIHFTNNVKLEIERSGDYRNAVIITFRSVGKAMFMTTAILCACFIMYVFSPLNTLMRIGTLAAVGLSSALLADYMLTPVLVYLTKPFGTKFPKTESQQKEAV